MFRHILVPIDGTELSTDTIGRAVDFAAKMEAHISFLYASPGYDRFLDEDDVYGVDLTPRKFAELSAARAQEILLKAEAAARNGGVACKLISTASDRPYEAITHSAREQACDLIIMAAHARRGWRGLLGSETQKVLMQSETPVLVMTTSRSAARINRAITIIQDEHRSLAIVVRGLLFIVNRMRTEGAQPPFALLMRMLRYIREFPEALHHPKEELYLFRKLQARTSSVDDVLRQLQHQHAEGNQLVQAMQEALDAYMAAPADALAGFAQATERYAQAQWRHMGLEESRILPAAREFLSDEDWTEITSAFSANGDSRFAGTVQDEFHEQFAAIYRYPAWQRS